jgi:hypothetical protein
MVPKSAAAVSARKDAMNQPSQPRVFIDLSDDLSDGVSTSGGAGH